MMLITGLLMGLVEVEKKPSYREKVFGVTTGAAADEFTDPGRQHL
jgi:hypothetical protein